MTTTLLALLLGFAQPVIPTCNAPSGATITLELALTDEERALGLMFRDVVPPDTGMLFIFPQDGIWPFWMKDTLVSLDLIWLDASGTVVEIRPAAPPCKLDPCPSFTPVAQARAVLEMVAGSVATHGIKPGVTLRFSNVPGYPVRAVPAAVRRHLHAAQHRGTGPTGESLFLPRDQDEGFEGVEGVGLAGSLDTGGAASLSFLPARA